MSKRTKIIILIIVSLVVIFLFIWLIMRKQVPVITRGLDTSVPSLPQSQTQNVVVPPVNNNPISNQEASSKPDLSVTLKSLAAAFAERYGSFSNQSNFKNLKDLDSSMTYNFFVQTEQYIKEQEAIQNNNSAYYGITSKTIKNQLTNLDEDKMEAELHLTMQRREAKDSMNSNIRIFYQDIIVNLKQERDKWKIDNAEWLIK